MAFDKDENALRILGDESRGSVGFSMPSWAKRIARGGGSTAQAVARHVARNPKTYATAAALLTAGAAMPIVLAAMKKDETQSSAPEEPMSAPAAPQPQQAALEDKDSIVGRGGHGGGHRGRHRGGGRRFRGGGGPWWGDDYFDPYYAPVYIERPTLDPMFDDSEESETASPKARQLASLRSQYLAAKKKGNKVLTQTLARRILALATS